MRRAARRGLLVIGAVLLLLFVSLAVPVPGWRRGEPDAPRLTVTAPPPLGTPPIRVWIDADPACGLGARIDPDDCFAILHLARSPQVRLVGLSSVFGNAPLPATDSVARALRAVLTGQGFDIPPVTRGAANAEDTAGSDAVAAALARVAADGPLVVVALGPLTNVSHALKKHAELRRRVTAVVAVMGRRRGHLFHPVEGGTAGSFLGHGPVFTDFNFRQDPAAPATMLETGVPIRLVPYEAARDVLMDRDELGRIAASGPAGAWVARRAEGWLEYWREEIGREGFYPFDLVAAMSVTSPGTVRCAGVTAWVGRDAGLLGWLGRRGLFVTERAAEAGGARVLYCPQSAGL